MRLLIVAEDAQQEAEMVWRARAARRLLDGGPQIAVSPRHSGLRVPARLDEGLYTRPLPDGLVVLGRHASCSSAVIARLAAALQSRPDLCAVTAAATTLVSDEELVMYGAAFRSGALCQAGGFVGDGHRSVRERLGAIGFGPVATLSPRPRPDAMRADRPVPVSA